jgi:FAD/FMN-containing dehydrogenase/Fe-S oxidoreductase
MNSFVPLPLSSHGKPVDVFPQAANLEKELKAAVKGEVRFDRGSRAMYATDASNYRQAPIGVVVPRDDSDVIAAVSVCRKYGAPVLSRGAGTSLAGQCCNVAVILDFTRFMNQIVEVNPEQQFARVQPGVVLDALRKRAEEYKLTFGPDPSTHNRCTIGGMIGNNSCGTHSLLAGMTVDNIEELRVLLYDGTEMVVVNAMSRREVESRIAEGGRCGFIYAELQRIEEQYGKWIRTRYPAIPRRVSGYNLNELLPENGFNVARSLVGSEGTCVIVLEAKVKLIHNPQYRSLVGIGYKDTFEAADHVPEILKFGPIGFEGFEGSIVDGLRRKGMDGLELLPEGRGIVMVEFGAASRAEADRLALQLVKQLKLTAGSPNLRIYTEGESRLVWKIRETGARSAVAEPGVTPQREGWDDAAVPPEKLGKYLRDIRKLLDEYSYSAQFYGHFGQGCIHMRVNFDLESETGIRKYGEFVERAADIVVSYGGSISGEHGDGKARGALLSKMFGPELIRAFSEFKAVWDQQNKMNPNNLVNTTPVTENLRLGADFNPLSPATHFTFPEDGGSFASASLRCIGLGECRKNESGTMCPSYMVTLEEEHSTRGRAHLLFESLQGEIVKGGWKDEKVKKAMDLCLSCKACKSECPTNVDIATYKAEFLAHFYENHSRPLNNYAFGMIDRWARLGSLFAPLSNFMISAPGFRQIARGALHLAGQRRVPRLANTSFQRWCRQQVVADVDSSEDSTPASIRARLSSKRGSSSMSVSDRRAVILWADTFNNYFHPDTCRAALTVLEAAGFNVQVSQSHLCCGRPLYDFGMLDKAKAYLEHILSVLSVPIAAGVPIVVLEPSCASVFRDELPNLLPANAGAKRLRDQTFLLGEFLKRYAAGFRPPQLSRKVLVHEHCHQKAVMKVNADEFLFKEMGVDFTLLDSGCCGMAGPFGFEREKYTISQAIGERVLLPAVRSAPSETLIVSDGFSCREQILHATGRRALHLAEVLRLAHENHERAGSG